MIRPRPLTLVYFFMVLVAIGVATMSCTKIPGHTTGSVSTASGSSGSSGSSSSSGGSSGSSGSTGGSSGTVVNPKAGTPNANGVGPVAVGATNTIIYQVNGGAVTTESSASGYAVSFVAIDYGGGVGQTGISAINTTSLYTFQITYVYLTPGIYSGLGGFSITNSTFNLADNLGTEKINVSTESVTPSTLTAFTPAKGTIKGTFDGTMVDSNSGLSLRVTGSFNLNQ